MAPLPNRVHPLAGSYWVVACNELRDIEEVCFGVLGKRRLAHARWARSTAAMRSSALAKTISAGTTLPSSN